jgi:hypothetical protein
MASTVIQHTLTNDQAKVVLESVQRSIGYLFRLKTRMEQRGFTRADLYSLVCKAVVSMQVSVRPTPSGGSLAGERGLGLAAMLDDGIKSRNPSYGSFGYFPAPVLSGLRIWISSSVIAQMKSSK